MTQLKSNNAKWFVWREISLAQDTNILVVDNNASNSQYQLKYHSKNDMLLNTILWNFTSISQQVSIASI